jgi:hypothetical protein
MSSKRSACRGLEVRYCGHVEEVVAKAAEVGVYSSHGLAVEHKVVQAGLIILRHEPDTSP